jgi:hypothetical protein
VRLCDDGKSQEKEYHFGLIWLFKGASCRYDGYMVVSQSKYH